MKTNKILLALATILFIGCENNDVIDPGNDPNFSIEINNDDGYNAFNRKVMVFDIPIYAKKKVADDRLLHAANIMAQYLDNDEDGEVDNQTVHSAMKAENAFLFLWNKQSDLLFFNPPNNALGQDLGNDETIINWHTNGHTGQFDASLEKVLHIITHAGYAKAYPDVFGEEVGTELSNAMDIARGGQFTSIPNSYPSEAWYHYDDASCDYSCMNTEYIYWALTSLLGAQENRLDEIEDEWELNTYNLVESIDVAVFNLLTDPQYKFPTILPDGTYKR